MVTALAAHEDLALIIHNASAFEPQAADLRCSWPSLDQFYRVFAWRLRSSSTGRWPPPLARQPNGGIITHHRYHPCPSAPVCRLRSHQGGSPFPWP